MKAKLLTLFSLLALLLVSTAILADGRPTGIRIGRLVSGGGQNVELDVTVVGTNRLYSGEFDRSTSVWIGPEFQGPFGTDLGQYTGPSQYVSFGISWGDGYGYTDVPLFGPPGGPFTGTFAHTYALPGSYPVKVFDVYGPDATGNPGKGVVPYTGNAISSSYRFVWFGDTTFYSAYLYGSTGTLYYPGGRLIAITANAIVNAGAGIPTLNLYGLLAMALVLVGTGLLVYRPPQRTVV